MNCPYRSPDVAARFIELEGGLHKYDPQATHKFGGQGVRPTGAEVCSGRMNVTATTLGDVRDKQSELKVEIFIDVFCHLFVDPFSLL